MNNKYFTQKTLKQLLIIAHKSVLVEYLCYLVPKIKIQNFNYTMQKMKLKTLPPNAIFPPCFLISFIASTYSCTPDFVCIGPYRVFAEI